MVKKEPNQTLHDIGASVKLTCSAGRLYAIEWYEQDANARWRKILSTKDDDSKKFETGKLKKNKTYKCEIERKPINYRSFKLVDIQLKGKRTIYDKQFGLFAKQNL